MIRKKERKKERIRMRRKERIRLRKKERKTAKTMLIQNQNHYNSSRDQNIGNCSKPTAAGGTIAVKPQAGGGAVMEWGVRAENEAAEPQGSLRWTF